MELFEKEKYSAARGEFDKVIEATEGEVSQVRAQAMFYNAMSSIRLYNLDAEYQVFRFIAENPESPRISELCFQLGNYFHYKMNWSKAIEWYNKVDRQELTLDERGEFYFKRGYAYYSRKNYEDARVDFYEILQTDTPYEPPATYYYSHIHYVEENYETALNGFRRIDHDPMFKSIAPYYISQILYMQKKYDEVIEYAPELMDSISDKRLGEMAKIIGESFFMLEQYADAIPYLETYRTNTRGFSIRDRYQMAFAYYKAGRFEEAISSFEPITYRKTEIAQSALYHLADCYLQLEDKNKARIAFSQASQMDFDARIQEDALFNYAKLTFEMSYNPFNEAIRAFNQYISYYPSSERMDEVYNYLVMAYLQTRNYSMALESLDKITIKNDRMKAAYQKVAFYRGLELYNNLRFIEAVDILEQSLEYGQYDPAIRARTYYWLGEAAYRSDDLVLATTYFNQFMEESIASRLKEYPLAHYSMAYVYFDQEAYPRAERWFNTYVRLAENKDSQTVADAYNRLGDCLFVQQDYWKAIEQYNESISIGRSDRDYALFQKGFTYGILNRLEQKLEVMLQIIREMKESAYVDDALFEAGRTYASLGQSSNAIERYTTLVSEYPNSSYISKALAQLGLIYFNDGQNDKALEYYTRVATDYPGTPEADNAFQSLESIYVRNNNVDGYLEFVNKLGRDISNKQQDSLMYVAAENAYVSGNCEEAIPTLDRYLVNNPNGFYLLNANYYKADCHLKLGQFGEAMESLEYIISQPRNMFSELALMAAARIHFDTEMYNKAVDNYLQLLEIAEVQASITEAKIGVMRCYKLLGEYSNTIEASTDVLNIEKLQEEVRREAWYNIATSYEALNNMQMAYEYYQKNADDVSSIEGAESKYKVILMKYEQNQYKAAEEEIYEFIEQNTPHQYWMGKAFLLLSDVYIAMGDQFQAIHTLKSIIDYYTIPDDGIIAEAKRRHENLAGAVDEQIPDENAVIQDELVN
jgi:tetratricopeptide (TPR) repeat protein